MSEERTFADYLDRSKLDALEETFVNLAAKLESEGYHRLEIVNALQYTIETRLKREGWISTNHYWKKMKGFAGGWHNAGEEWKDTEQARRDKARAKAQEKGRENKRGQTLN
jgi:hypothetical protein